MTTNENWMRQNIIEHLRSYSKMYKFRNLAAESKRSSRILELKGQKERTTKLRLVIYTFVKLKSSTCTQLKDLVDLKWRSNRAPTASIIEEL